jgi:hypothetical protein
MMLELSVTGLTGLTAVSAVGAVSAVDGLEAVGRVGRVREEEEAEGIGRGSEEEEEEEEEEEGFEGGIEEAEMVVVEGSFSIMLISSSTSLTVTSFSASASTPYLSSSCRWKYSLRCFSQNSGKLKGIVKSGLRASTANSHSLMPVAFTSISKPIKMALFRMFKLETLFELLVFLGGFFETLFFTTFSLLFIFITFLATGSGDPTVGADNVVILRRGCVFVVSRDSIALMVGLRTRDELRISEALVEGEGLSAVPSDSKLPIYWSNDQPGLSVLSGKSMSEISFLDVSSAAVLLVRRLL